MLYIDYELPEIYNNISIHTLINDIAKFTYTYNQLNHKAKQFVITSYARIMAVRFIHMNNIYEGVGTQTEPDTYIVLSSVNKLKSHTSIKETETISQLNAMQYLQQVRQQNVKQHNLSTDNPLQSVIDSELVQDVASHILSIKSLPYRSGTAYAELDKQRIHVYPHPDIIDSNILAACDIYFEELNNLSLSFSGMRMFDRIMNIYRTAARVMFDIVDIHPYGDGNGRLCRLLMNHVLACITPFPVAVDVNRNEYIDAIGECRYNDYTNRVPSKLCAIILYCAHKQWGQLFRMLEEQGLYGSKTVTQLVFTHMQLDNDQLPDKIIERRYKSIFHDVVDNQTKQLDYNIVRQAIQHMQQNKISTYNVKLQDSNKETQIIFV